MFEEIYTVSFWLSSITTILGFSVLGIYYKQKRDYKEDAARVVLTELRHAQKQIDRFKLSNIDLRFFDKIMLDNSWVKYCYLFVRDLDDVDMDFITDFYGRCVCVEKVLAELEGNIQRLKK